MRGWITEFPQQGEWFHLHNLLSVGIISEWLQENYREMRVKAITIMGDEPRKWRLTTRSKVKTFCAYLRNHTGTSKAKLRIEYKPRATLFGPQ